MQHSIHPIPHVAMKLACAVMAFSVPMSAACAADKPASWQYELTPYVWAAGLDGTIRINGIPGPGQQVQQDFSDILERLDFGLMGAFEARKGRWALLLDGAYTSLSDTGSFIWTVGENGVVVDGKAKVTQEMYALAGAYRLNEGPHVVDVIGGLRYNSIAWDVDVAPASPIVNFKNSESWVDPYIGIRVQHPLGERLSVEGYADVGGFDVGSDLSWQASAGINYQFTPGMTGKLGYRHIYNDYDNDGFTYDMASSGVYVGLGMRW